MSLRTKKGDKLIVQIYLSPLSAIQMIAILRDVTKLRLAEQFYEDLMDNLLDAVIN
jgi:hypothetical protein